MFSIFLFVLVFNCNLLDTTIAKSNGIKPIWKRTIASAFFSNNSTAIGSINSTVNRSASCKWLRGFKHQRNMCQRRRGMADVLIEAQKLAKTHCEQQFRYDRWNCSYKRDMFKKVYLETAFMQSLTTASLMYATARACSDGKLQNCYCGTHEEKAPKPPGWKWGGCSDNIKNSRHITRKLMLIKQQNDASSEVLNHDTEIGIKTVIEKTPEHCNCHGVSASCVMKICWKRIESFSNIAERLKNHYHSAIKVNPVNTVNKSRPWHENRMLYLANSSKFCHLTAGRRCLNVHHCETLCCSRGYTEQTVITVKRCHYRFHENRYNVSYKVCEVKENVLNCK